MLLRVIFSMALVLGAMWLATRAARRYSQGGAPSLMGRFGVASKARKAPLIENRVSLTRQTVLAVVNFEGRRLLIAASDTATTVLDRAETGTGDPEDLVQAGAVEAGDVAAGAGASIDLASAVHQSLQPVSFLDHLRAVTTRIVPAAAPGDLTTVDEPPAAAMATPAAREA